MYWGAEDRKDLLVGRSDGRVMLFANTNTDESPEFDAGVFLEFGFPGSKFEIDVGSRACPTVVDWDNDGRRDLVVGDYDGYVSVYLNTGTDAVPDFLARSFVQASGVNIDVVSNRASPHVQDVDNDGRKDLLAGNTNGEIVFYRNTGTDAAPDFSGYEFIEADSVKIDLAGTPRSRPFVCDWNMDGQTDLLVGAGDGLVHLYVGIDHEAGVTDGTLEEALDIAHLFPPSPNPFADASVVAFELAEPAHVEVSVYDIAGRRVATLADQRFAPGRHELTWAGRNSRGAGLANGVYMVRMRAGEGVATRKALLLR
ncbi:MAG: T9SS type A sorting domain-containing protein [Candidatus Eisenbacteria bacterium]